MDIIIYHDDLTTDYIHNVSEISIGNYGKLPAYRIIHEDGYCITTRYEYCHDTNKIEIRCK